MFGSIIKSLLPQAKGYLGELDSTIVEKLNTMPIPCNREAGEYTAFTIIASKKGESYIVPCVYSKDDKLVSKGAKMKVTEFLTQIIDMYGSK